jgi:hypothetical protein
MSRTIAFLVLALFPVLALAQTPPPGNPYDPAKHPNPIITFVEEKDFRNADYAEIEEDGGIEVLGLSQSEGKRESMGIADGKFVKSMNIFAGIRTDVTFYPVVRQEFKLSAGTGLMLHSFRFPKVSLPKDFGKAVLNEAATEKKKKPAEMRFGGLGPEVLEIRGTQGLLFENDGKTTIYWQEAGVGHTATSTLPRRELFRIIEDLL